MKLYAKCDRQWNIEFIYSPLFEMLCSLHVLIKPEHHLERLDWANEMRSKLPSKLLDKLVEMGKKTFDWCVVMDLCNIHEQCDDFNTMSAISFIEDLPTGEFEYVFSKYTQHEKQVFGEAHKREMISMLKEYYLVYFERELRYIEPLLVRCLKKDSELCEKVGILEYIKKLHSRIEVTDKAFLFHKYTLYTIPLDELKTVIIRISSFIDPHLLMDYGDDIVQVTIRVHLDKGTDDIPRDLLRLIKALSDETRMRILRILYKKKSSTQSLADELKLTEACISKHLKLLYEAELLYKERSGSFIYYYLNTSLIDRVPLEIYEYLNF